MSESWPNAEAGGRAGMEPKGNRGNVRFAVLKAPGIEGEEIKSHKGRVA